jgi:hypothetical protein
MEEERVDSMEEGSKDSASTTFPTYYDNLNVTL